MTPGLFGENDEQGIQTRWALFLFLLFFLLFGWVVDFAYVKLKDVFETLEGVYQNFWNLVGARATTSFYVDPPSPSAAVPTHWENGGDSPARPFSSFLWLMGFSACYFLYMQNIEKNRY